MTGATAATRRLVHGHVELALHRLRGESGPRLLLLHELGGRAPTEVPAAVAGWDGAIFALDFTGHGASSVPAGGGYTAELLMADADVALAELGEATVVGWGLGAYVALLLAGGRPRAVRGAVLCDGRGLAGGGERGAPPDPGFVAASQAPPDPYALHELGRDARPVGYAALYARQAQLLSEVPDQITVAAMERPPWLSEILRASGVVEGDVGETLVRYQAFVPSPCTGS
ncbi:MAG: alpha/beta hydrolase [Thermoanaerobaculia bacterium]|nr:alpha/beta hydrolase [Thermoanaerobaculia bacterium]